MSGDLAINLESDMALLGRPLDSHGMKSRLGQRERGLMGSPEKYFLLVSGRIKDLIKSSGTSDGGKCGCEGHLGSESGLDWFCSGRCELCHCSESSRSGQQSLQ